MKTKKPAKGELTVTQESAVDLLASGKNDTETAEALGIHRVTVTRWRNYSPEFRATLADRRRMIWGSSADLLRSMLPKALKVLQGNLDSDDWATRTQAAYGIIRTAGKLPLEPVEPTDPDDYVQQTFDRELNRLEALIAKDDEWDQYSGLPQPTKYFLKVHKRLDQLSASSEPR